MSEAIQIPEDVQELIDELKKEFNVKAIEYRPITGRLKIILPWLTGDELYLLQKMVSEIIDISPTYGPDVIKFESKLMIPSIKNINLEIEVKP